MANDTERKKPNDPEADQPEMNAVFQGGGAKGVALVGALARVVEESVRFAAVAGTSAGAILAALYAAGYTPPELKSILQETPLDTLLDPHWLKWPLLLLRRGLHKGDVLYDWIFKLLAAKGVEVFGDLNPKTPGAARTHPRLVVVATDITERKPIYFDSDVDVNMKIAEAVRMSISIPLFFDPVNFGRAVVVDGGMISNYPLHVFRTSKLRTLGFRLVPSALPAAPRPIKTRLDYARALVDTLLDAHDREDARTQANAIAITIETGDVRTTDFNLPKSKMNSLYKQGYKAAEQFLGGPNGRLVKLPFEQAKQERAQFQEVSEHLVKTLEGLPKIDIDWNPRVRSKKVEMDVLRVDGAVTWADQLRLVADETMSRSYVDIARYYRYLGVAYLVTALDRLERAVELDPGNDHAWRYLGQTQSVAAFETGDGPGRDSLIEKAEKSLSKAQSLTPEPLALLEHDWAWLRAEQGRFAEAVERYGQAIELERRKPNQDPMWVHGVVYNRACGYACLGRYQEALADLETVDPSVLEGVLEDDELQPMLQDPEVGPKLRALDARALARRNKSSGK